MNEPSMCYSFPLLLLHCPPFLLCWVESSLAWISCKFYWFQWLVFGYVMSNNISWWGLCKKYMLYENRPVDALLLIYFVYAVLSHLHQMKAVKRIKKSEGRERLSCNSWLHQPYFWIYEFFRAQDFLEKAEDWSYLSHQDHAVYTVGNGFRKSYSFYIR